MSGSSSLNSVSLTANSLVSQRTNTTNYAEYQSSSLYSSSIRQDSPSTTNSTTSSFQQNAPSLTALKYTAQELQNPLFETALTKNFDKTSKNYNSQELLNRRNFEKAIEIQNLCSDKFPLRNRSTSRETLKKFVDNNKNYSIKKNESIIKYRNKDLDFLKFNIDPLYTSFNKSFQRHPSKDNSTIYPSLDNYKKSRLDCVYPSINIIQKHRDTQYLSMDNSNDEKIYANLLSKNLPTSSSLESRNRFNRNTSHSPLRSFIDNKTIEKENEILNNRTTSSNFIKTPSLRVLKTSLGTFAAVKNLSLNEENKMDTIRIDIPLKNDNDSLKLKNSKETNTNGKVKNKVVSKERRKKNSK